jgi:hypothetical protein
MLGRKIKTFIYAREERFVKAYQGRTVAHEQIIVDGYYLRCRE